MSVGYSFAQAPTGNHPCDAKPFCSDSSYVFPNVTGQSSNAGVGGVNYGCLFTSPNQIWYYMQIGVDGTIQLGLQQTNNNNNLIDIDFAMWGPFTDLATGCAAVTSGLYPLQCSYSASATETLGLGLSGGVGAGQSTPPAAQVGEIYIIVLTNYSGQAGTISFEQTGGTGSADCSILYCNLELGNNGPVCANSPVELWATNDTAQFFEWKDPNGLVISNNATTTTTWDQEGTFDFTMTSIIGEDTCVNTTSVTFLPSTYDSTMVEICQGEFYEYRGERYYTSDIRRFSYTNLDGCDSTYVLNLIVNPMPEVEISGPDLYELCEGDKVTFGVAGSGGNTTYQWHKNGDIIPGETGPSITVDRSGVYHVTAITNKGCEGTSGIVRVKVHDVPVVSITNGQLDVLCTFDTISLSATSSVEADLYWEPEYVFRNFPLENTGANVRGVFSKGDELVTVRAVSPYGCSSTAEVMVYAKPCCEVNIPSAFTPDNDGLNDVFAPIMRPTQKIINFSVYDRYGQVVYTTSSTSEEGIGWDGNYPNGKQAEIDSYLYTLEYTCADGKNYNMNGSVTLIR